MRCSVHKISGIRLIPANAFFSDWTFPPRPLGFCSRGEAYHSPLTVNQSAVKVNCISAAGIEGSI
jgi:hypothetical protein